MIPGDFLRKLRTLNRNLRIYCGNDDSKPATLYHVYEGEFTSICSVDKNFIPRYAIADERNRILKSGWQRTLRVLIQKGFTTKREAEKVFGSMDRRKVKVYKTEEENDRVNDIHQRKLYHGEIDKNGQPIFSRNEVLDMKAELDMAGRK
jgi:hypothetical protein